jgi:hypothetical protein
MDPMRTLLAAFVALSLAAAPRRAIADFETQAKQFKNSNALTQLADDENALDASLDTAFVSIDVGIFDVRYLRSALSDAKHFDDLKGILLGLIDLHVHLLAWVAEKDPGKPQAASTPELTTFRAWVAGWKPDLLKKITASKTEGHDLAALAGADAGVLAAIKASAASLRSGAAAGLQLDVKPTRLALLPSRGDFTGFAAYVGSLQEEWKTILWTSALPVRNEFHINDLLGLPLESPASDGGPVGVSMNDREPTGLFEHVTQYAADRLLKDWFGSALEVGVETGAAIDLVIELYGENNARVFGSGEGRSTPGRNKFVRGGASHGGKFAKMNADPKWRVDKGKDYFLVSLRRAQQDGASLAAAAKESAPSPNAHFALDCKEMPGEHDFVTAPFLGAFAANVEVPEAFLPDFQECLRAYRAASVHWLLIAAKPKSDTAPPRPFARLLRSCVTDAAKPFDERLTAIYGMPLATDAPAKDALEWNFLEWLAKGK